MADFPTQKITIYHKNQENKWERYVKEASYRKTSISSRNRNGLGSSTVNRNKSSNSTDDVLIRIFNIKEYNLSWFVEKDDIVVNKEVNDSIKENTPLTQLSNKYGRDNVHKINSIEKLIFKDKDIEELNHIKLGCI